MSPRHHVLMFDRRFVADITDGTKRQTYRKPRARPIRPGDTISLRHWEGVAYRSIQIEIAEVVCTSVEFARLTAVEITHRHAVDDGFPDRDSMIDYFDLPFRGYLIRWGTP